MESLNPDGPHMPTSAHSAGGISTLIAASEMYPRTSGILPAGARGGWGAEVSLLLYCYCLLLRIYEFSSLLHMANRTNTHTYRWPLCCSWLP